MQEKDIVKFGSYPQNRVRDAGLLERLNAAAGELPNKSGLGKWTSFHFYMKGEKSDYMFYTDVVLDGKKYRGVYIKEYRPYDIVGDSKISEQSGHQGYFGFYRDRVYWFLYEPIPFDVLDTCEDGNKLLYSHYVLDATQFGTARPWRYVPYESSDVREWLNGEFLGTAFTAEQQDLLCEYGCETDKITLLSVDEYTKYCVTGEGWRKTKRLTTDYARCMGVNAESAYGICNFYWLRTVKEDDDDAVFYGVGTLGNIENMQFKSGSMDGGVAVCIKLKHGE